VAAAVSVSGLEDGSFAFLGFPPSRSKDRNNWFAKCRRLHEEVTVVVFEAPHRIRQTLSDLRDLVKQPIFVFRELTKLHEEALAGTTAELLAALPEPQGEFTIVIPQAPVAVADVVGVDKLVIIKEFGHLTSMGGGSRRQIAREVGRKFGLSTKQIYEMTKEQAG
jgi:16S rRNA (cytidine1402-2'-O)-methyltransferase